MLEKSLCLGLQTYRVDSTDLKKIEQLVYKFTGCAFTNHVIFDWEFTRLGSSNFCAMLLLGDGFRVLRVSFYA